MKICRSNAVELLRHSDQDGRSLRRSVGERAERAVEVYWGGLRMLRRRLDVLKAA